MEKIIENIARNLNRIRASGQIDTKELESVLNELNEQIQEIAEGIEEGAFGLVTKTFETEPQSIYDATRRFPAVDVSNYGRRRFQVIH